jgi:hypothetical protein
LRAAQIPGSGTEARAGLCPFILTLAAVLISGMLQTAKPDQSTEAAARRGRKEKFHNVYATEKIPLGVFPVSIFDTGNT